MTHVFIVNKTTFKIHLENMFAGTGASNVPTDFIFDSNLILNTQDEKRSVGMISDLARIRVGDKIIFFVTGIAKFYGIFEAASDFFVDPNDEHNYLHKNLEKKLTYRILIKPYKVYQNGLQEYDYLDSLNGLEHPDELCWSLIYRKLGGNRGCTMITDAEYELFERRISTNNSILQGEHFTFNQFTNQIESTENTNIYRGRCEQVIDNLKKNLYTKYARGGSAFEHYLQFLAILTLKDTTISNRVLSSNKPITWIGNEVMCSFGEHRIDIVTIQEDAESVDITLIELKDEKISEDILWQIRGYLVWLKDYILPTYLRKQKTINVYPVIISDGIPNARPSTRARLQHIEDSVSLHDWTIFNSTNVEFKQTKIIHFREENSAIVI